MYSPFVFLYFWYTFFILTLTGCTWNRGNNLQHEALTVSFFSKCTNQPVNHKNERDGFSRVHKIPLTCLCKEERGPSSIGREAHAESHLTLGSLGRPCIFLARLAAPQTGATWIQHKSGESVLSSFKKIHLDFSSESTCLTKFLMARLLSRPSCFAAAQRTA